MERATKGIVDLEAKKEREYRELAGKIIDAIGVKIRESGKRKFKVPFGYGLIRGGGIVAKCGIWAPLSHEPRKAIVIEEEDEGAYIRAPRGITAISEFPYDFPFVRFTEEISEGSDLKQLINCDKNSRHDIRPTMLHFLESIKEWEAVA